ncbi:unnamed protein product [Acanthoscelides obtectus]|uniref:THAP-type domain-containing protein n=1 Tax=Acanthoscelides obtectus TaxID=200917 RepID=A0A9P0P6E2_ACAOB|nr:unnamed protein product [Acanthoscelides obtectus]CAK1666846.1 THAP domain-containing protein 4 [Acanthoscelides obtectus]
MPCCAAVNCKNRHETGYRTFTFPADPERRKKWLRNMRRRNYVPTKCSGLCEVHFDEDQWEKHRADGWRKLKSTAIPTLFDFSGPKVAVRSKRKSNRESSQRLKLEPDSPRKSFNSAVSQSLQKNRLILKTDQEILSAPKDEV